MSDMRTRVMKLVRGAAGVALVAGGMGVIGGLGLGLAQTGVAGAEGTPVSGTYACHTPVGVLSVPSAIVDLNTAPSGLYKNTTYTLKPKVTFSVPGTLIGLAAEATLTTVTISGAKLHLKLSGFTATTTLTESAANLPQTVPVNATTEASGASVTITYAAVTVTMKAGSGTATVTPGNLTMDILVSFACDAPTSPALGAIDSIAALGVTPLSLSPAAGALPGAQATVHYAENTYWTASGGGGGDTWSATGVPAGLTFTSSGNHASLHGTPSAAGAATITVTVRTTTGHSVTQAYTLSVAAAPSTPKVLQPFSLTVTPGHLTLTCGTGPVATQVTAKTCTAITLGHVTLNETNQEKTDPMHTLYISTARGGPTDAWTLDAVMVPSATSLTGNSSCGTVQGFCNATTTNATRIANHLINTSITPNYLSLHGVSCKPQRTTSTPAKAAYYNSNPTPASNATGGTLAATLELCSAAAGSSGGEFIVGTGAYTLIVPPNVYVGKYYGTVQYTLVAS